MPRDFSKTPGNRRNLVRQIKGPGMNLGLKKRHALAKPKLKAWKLQPRANAKQTLAGGNAQYTRLFEPVQTTDYSKQGTNRRKTRTSGKVKTGGFF